MTKEEYIQRYDIVVDAIEGLPLQEAALFLVGMAGEMLQQMPQGVRQSAGRVLTGYILEDANPDAAGR